MNLIPKRWNLDTMVCGIRGHCAPAAVVAVVNDNEPTLGFHRPNPDPDAAEDDRELRWCRCLRCDAWIVVVRPAEPRADSLPTQVGELARPRRGLALRNQAITRLIAIERGAHVIVFGALFALIILVEFGLPGIRDEARELLTANANVLGETRAGQSLLLEGLAKLEALTPERVAPILLLLAAYIVIEGLEAVFLWRGKRWAEYLTVVATAGFIPLELHELIEKVSVPRLAFLLINVAIVVYLIVSKRLFGLRGGTAELERREAADANWDTILTSIPVATTVDRESWPSADTSRQVAP